GPVARDSSTGGTTHCIKAVDVILRNRHGVIIEPGSVAAHSVEILYRSHKGDQVRQGTVIRHYRSGESHLCPVIAAETCLRVRPRWLHGGRRLGPFLTSVNATSTIKKSEVAILIKQVARTQGLDPSNYACHSMRIGGACALLAAGKRETVIRLMGRCGMAGMRRIATTGSLSVLPDTTCRVLVIKGNADHETKTSYSTRSRS
ncbi:hypothetical protein PPTG_24862, partial [Phytophthora nicotianae INRA-310]